MVDADLKSSPADCADPTPRLLVRNEAGAQCLTPRLIERLRDDLAAIQGSAVAILESDGSSFCEGMDLSLAVHPGFGGMAELFADLLNQIVTSPTVMIALVEGPAVGGGVGLAAAADVVIATPLATFGLPETLFGLAPAIVLPYLARRVGPARARLLALGGMTIDAHQAWRIGLVDEVVEDAGRARDQWVRRYGLSEPQALAEVKALSTLLERHPGGHGPRAIAALERLRESAGTRDRIGRFLAGDTPWPEDRSP